VAAATKTRMGGRRRREPKWEDRGASGDMKMSEKTRKCIPRRVELVGHCNGVAFGVC